MVIGELALIFAAFYVGLAIYIVLIEQPARLSLNSQALLGVWKSAYNRGHVIGISTTLITAILGIAAFVISHQVFWLAGAIAILLNVPYTLTFIRPTNNKLLLTQPEFAGDETRELIVKWEKLHRFRCIFGTIAVLLFLLAVINMRSL